MMTPSQPSHALAPRLALAAKGLALGLLWLLLYACNRPFSEWAVFDFLGLASDSAFGHAMQFFLYDVVKITLLLILMLYVVSFLRAGLSVEKVRVFLQNRNHAAGYVMGAVFGAVTPFCSCSSVPLFLGFTTGGIPLGITMAFLITSPVINEVGLVLLWELIGWKLTLLYVAAGLLIGILGGLLIDCVNGKRWLQPFLLQLMTAGTARAAVMEDEPMTLTKRHNYAKGEMRDVLRRIFKWILLGVLAGALIHGFVPEAWVLEHLQSDNAWSVPAAVALGLPLYTNVTGIVPVMENLLMKGLPVGTTLAFCLSTVAVSLPEILMLKQVMRLPLIVFFVGYVLLILTTFGFLFNLTAPNLL